MTKLNKKGFTLVELLAVIAILAILMLLITPNILDLFIKGKEDVFRTQVQSIWKSADREYVTDMTSGILPGPYCYNGKADGTDGNNVLSISENKKLHYYIDFEGKKVKTLRVTDGTYYYDSSLPDFELGMDSIVPKQGKATISCSDGTLTVQ